MPRHNNRVAAPKPLAEEADLTHFKGGILNILWRYELTHAQRSVFVAVLFLFLTHLAVNACFGSGAMHINNTPIWGAAEAVRSACQDWLVNPWGSWELRNFVAKWEDLVADAVDYILIRDPEISTSMPYWLDWYGRNALLLVSVRVVLQHY